MLKGIRDSLSLKPTIEVLSYDKKLRIKLSQDLITFLIILSGEITLWRYITIYDTVTYLLNYIAYTILFLLIISVKLYHSLNYRERLTNLLYVIDKDSANSSPKCPKYILNLLLNNTIFNIGKYIAAIIHLAILSWLTKELLILLSNYILHGLSIILYIVYWSIIVGYYSWLPRLNMDGYDIKQVTRYWTYYLGYGLLSTLLTLPISYTVLSKLLLIDLLAIINTISISQLTRDLTISPSIIDIRALFSSWLWIEERINNRLLEIVKIR